MTKDEWGRQGWAWLHNLAINYRYTPTQEDARAAFRQVWDFATQLPCPECRLHATQYVRAHPPNLADTYAFQHWVWEFHNAVNRRLKKPEVSYEDYQELYAAEILRAESRR